MPYNADLRCSYASVEMNTAWLYSLFNDYGVTEPVFKEEYMSKVFESKADRWADDYIKAKVFWTGKPPKDDPDFKAIMNCETIWEYLWEQAQDWLDEHKGWLEDDSNENEDEVQAKVDVMLDKQFGKCRDCSVQLSEYDQPNTKCQDCQ